MATWYGGLEQTLSEAADAFGIRQPIRGRPALARACQTGFVWTRQPGVVCLAANRSYLAAALENPGVVAVLVPPALGDEAAVDGKAVVVAEHPDELYHHLHALQRFEPGPDGVSVDPDAEVHPSAVLQGPVTVGAGSVIGPRVVIEGPVTIGRDVTIEAGAIVGCEGLYAKRVGARRLHVPHFGGVAIGDGVFIHAGVVVVRSAVRGEATIIGDRSHIGVLSNIGHDVVVGAEVTVSSNVVIAGRARIGEGVWIGASATVSNMVSVGARAEVRLGAVVIQDVPPGGDVSGNFARGHTRNMKQFLKEVRDGA